MSEVIDLSLLYPQSSTSSSLSSSTELQAVEAAENSDIDAGNKFMKKEEDDGNTTLHIAIKQEEFGTVEDLLLDVDNRDINALNTDGQSPLYLALIGDNKNIIRLLLHRKDIDLDSPKYDGKSCHDLIEEKYPAMILFHLLYHKKTKEFIERAKINYSLLNEDDGFDTFVQYACRQGFADVVETLLNLDVDPNKKCGENQDSVLKIATFNSCHEILRMLLMHRRISVQEEPYLIFELFKGINTTIYFGFADENHNYRRCLKLLLKETDVGRLNINRLDSDGNHILHHAAYFIDDEYVSHILQYHPFLGITNKSEKHTIEVLKPHLIQKYLDNCISTNGKLKRESDFAVTFNFKFLVPLAKLKSSKEHFPENLNHFSYETDPLLKMSSLPDFKEHLTHPVLTGFLNLKWHTIRTFYYINLLFYLAFWVTLTWYVLGKYVSWSTPVNSPANNTSDNSTCNVTQQSTAASTTSEPIATGSSSNPNDPELMWLKMVTLVFLAILCFRELSQFCVSPFSYLKSVENLLEVILIVGTGVVLFFETKANNHGFAALVILISTFEGVLLIGRHPKLSTYVEMFKTVSVNFLKFFTMYGLLILAFALSFSILFNKTERKFFVNPAISSFKTFVMMTGELEASSMDFDTFPIIGHVAFILFVFLIQIVLLSLLNGLAVSDIQQIQADAEMLAIVYRIKLISYFERMSVLTILVKMSNLLSKVCCYCSARPKEGAVDLFPDIMPDYEAHIYPNHNNAVSFQSRFKFDQKEYSNNSWYGRLFGWRINSDIVEAAQIIIETRRRGNREVVVMEDLVHLVQDCSQQLKQYEPKLEIVERIEIKFGECFDRVQIVEEISERNEELLKKMIDTLQQKSYYSA